MSAQENNRRLQAYLINQSFKSIDYEWEIQHHREMHEAYEKLKQYGDKASNS